MEVSILKGILQSYESNILHVFQADCYLFMLIRHGTGNLITKFRDCCHNTYEKQLHNFQKESMK
jgi:hypothetical protein